MKKKFLMINGALILALAACDPVTPQDRIIVGGLTGAAIGGLTAKALEGDDDWVIIGGLAGATIGTLVAPHRETNRCPYARGDGTYYTRPCR